MCNIPQKYSAKALKMDPKSLQDRPRGPKKASKIAKRLPLKFDCFPKRVWCRVWRRVWWWFGGGLVFGDGLVVVRRITLRHARGLREGGEGKPSEQGVRKIRVSVFHTLP